MNNKLGSILFITITLSIGVSTYILFRPPLYWFPKIDNWNTAIINISWLPSLLSSFILYHLSDVMWALALTETLYIIKNNLLFAVLITFVLTLLFEVMQYFMIVRGTGDILDIIFVSISLSIYYLIRKE